MTRAMTQTPSIQDLILQPIETIIPHRGTMLLIDAVSTFSEDALSARASVNHAKASSVAPAAPSW